MATEKWIAGSGVGLTWTAAFGSSDLNSIASGNAILSSLSGITNGTSLDIFCDVAIVLASAAFVAPASAGIYLYPLHQDGSTYGDGRFTSSAAGAPPQIYNVATIGFVAATQAQQGQALRIVMPPGTFKFVYFNNGGVALAASGNN